MQADPNPTSSTTFLRYFREVDGALQPYLQLHPWPLVLACVGYLASIYREANSYARLIDEVVTGNPDEQHSDWLREAAWQVIEPRLLRVRDEAVARYRSLAGTGRTTADPAEAALAAIDGRIDVVFVAVGLEHWGRINLDTHSVERHAAPEADDQDLLEVAAINTLKGGGTVFTMTNVETPEAAGIAAILRH